MWHQHLRDNDNYARDCQLLCGGHFVRHFPDGGLNVEARNNRLEATRQALLELYGEEQEGELDMSATGPWKEVFEGERDSEQEEAESDEEEWIWDPRSSGPADAAQASGEQEEDNEEEDIGAWLVVVVTITTGDETRFRVRPTTRMGSILAEFARRMRAPDPSMYNFHFRGGRLAGASDSTPRSLGMQNGDRILAVR
jgi:hypothetical protein